MIRFACPRCERKLSVADTLAGRVGSCPQCGTKVRIPGALEALPADEPPPKRREAVASPPPEVVPVKKRRPPEVVEDVVEVVPPDEGVRSSAPPPPRPRRRRDEDDDDRRDEDEDRPARPSGRRRKKRRRRSTSQFGGMDPFLIGLLGVGGVGLLLVILTFIFPLFGLLALGFGWLVSIAGGLWFLVLAFQDSATEGLLCMFVPFYGLYYLLTHFEEVKQPFFLNLIGVGILMGTSVAGVAGFMRMF
jgi:hypothetical protein